VQAWLHAAGRYLQRLKGKRDTYGETAHMLENVKKRARPDRRATRILSSPR